MSLVLVIEDEPAILRGVADNLKFESYDVLTAADGESGFGLLVSRRPDLVILDLMLPKMSGYDVCRKARAAGIHTPILMLTARGEEMDRVAGLDLGADDYVTKPFSLPVLAARLSAVLRRYESCLTAGKKLKKDGIELDPGGRTVSLKGKPVSLTRKEFDLLALLLGQPGRLMSVPYLLETVWGYDPADYNDPGTVEVHVSHLRKKLGPKTGKHIVSVLGHGYKFEA